MILIMSDHWTSAFENARVHRLEPGQTLFRRDDRVQSVFLVRDGSIALQRALTDGGLLTLHVAQAGNLVAEASLFSEHYHCDAVSETSATVAVLPRARLLSLLEASTQQSGLATKAMAAATRDIQSLRTRIEIMRLRRVCDRLDAYLDLYEPPAHGKWVQVADWIGVSPPALYRELARRRLGP